MLVFLNYVHSFIIFQLQCGRDLALTWTGCELKNMYVYINRFLGFARDDVINKIALISSQTVYKIAFHLLLEFDGGIYQIFYSLYYNSTKFKVSTFSKCHSTGKNFLDFPTGNIWSLGVSIITSQIRIWPNSWKENQIICCFYHRHIFTWIPPQAHSHC